MSSKSKKCPKGQILRKAYTRKDGVRVKAVCIKDTGLPGKGPDLFGKLKKGELKKHGYSSKKSQLSRHRALGKAVREFGWKTVKNKIQVLVIFNKNKNPELSALFVSDRDWIKAKYGKKKN